MEKLLPKKVPMLLGLKLINWLCYEAVSLLPPEKNDSKQKKTFILEIN